MRFAGGTGELWKLGGFLAQRIVLDKQPLDSTLSPHTAVIVSLHWICRTYITLGDMLGLCLIVAFTAFTSQPYECGTISMLTGPMRQPRIRNLRKPATPLPNFS